MSKRNCAFPSRWQVRAASKLCLCVRTTRPLSARSDRARFAAFGGPAAKYESVGQAIEFARRGWAAVVVMRRGYGGSDGNWAEGYGSCANPNYIAAGTASAADLKAAIALLETRPDIDPSRVISVGVSAGGFATVALTADPPPGLVAAINFAGGRGSQSDDEVCREDRLIEAYRFFGKRARIPVLWVYAENDHFFGPRLAQQFRDAFIAGGASVEFITAPAFGSDGHGLFSLAGIPVWSGFVDAFLQRQGLRIRATLLPPPPRPALNAPVEPIADQATRR
jgi:dienelactone hydrolase